MSDMEAKPVTTPVERTSQSVPSRAEAPLTRPERVARAIRFSVDMFTVALFLYCQLQEIDGFYGVVVFWLISFTVFPYARMRVDARGNRQVAWTMLVLGVVIVGFGLVRDLGPVRDVFHGTPTNDSMLMGVVLALSGLTSVLDPVRPPSVRRLLLGIATLVAGAVWVWFSLPPSPASVGGMPRLSPGFDVVARVALG